MLAFGQIYVIFDLDMSHNTREFRSADLRTLLQTDQHVLRALLALDPLASRTRTKRSPTSFSPLDAMFLLVMSRLHTLGFSPKALQGVSAAIHQVLTRPVATGRGDELRLHQAINGRLTVGGPPSEGGAIEITVPLRPVRLQLLQYTGADQIVGQAELALLGQLSSAPSRRANTPRRSRS
jgi:hypothetical protein